MSLENIKKEIEAKAASAGDDLLAEAAAKAKGIEAKAASEVKQLEKEFTQKLDAEVAVLRNRERSLANMESQKAVFEARKKALAEVFEVAENKIKNMLEGDRENAVKKMIAAARDQIDVSVVYANAQDSSFVEGAEVKEIDTTGCIICETKDGQVRVDYTFPTLFKQVKDSTIAEVSKKLFN